MLQILEGERLAFQAHFLSHANRVHRNSTSCKQNRFSLDGGRGRCAVSVVLHSFYYFNSLKSICKNHRHIALQIHDELILKHCLKHNYLNNSMQVKRHTTFTDSFILHANEWRLATFVNCVFIKQYIYRNKSYFSSQLLIFNWYSCTTDDGWCFIQNIRYEFQTHRVVFESIIILCTAKKPKKIAIVIFGILFVCNILCDKYM